MSIFSAIVLFAVIWFLALLTVLPIGIRTQDEDGRVVRGTPSSAPVDAMIRRKLVAATLVALAVWVPIIWLIVWSGLTIRDLDIWGRM
jgi:predicted secreted protein